MFKTKQLPIDDYVSDAVDYLVANYREVFQVIKWPVDQLMNGTEWVFLNIHPLIIIALVAFLAWKYTNKTFTVFSIIALFLIGFLGIWNDTMITLSMVISSVIFCLIAGIPLGILVAKNKTMAKIIRPILDAMQTTPAFVYLVPIVMLFSIGNVAGVIATIVFALPPMVRLTALGIEQVDSELIEATKAFGATPKQMLIRVEIPMAMPSILAGLNQTIMMALSMVVIASLIGAGGLGSPVVQGLNTLDIGLAFIGGLGIVLLAILLDRLTQSIASK